MGTWDVRLLSASYASDENENVYLELFGKTRDKKSITILCFDYKAYYYVVDPNDAVEKILKNDPDVVSFSPDRLYYKGDYHNVLKVTVKFPWKVPEYRNNWKNAGYHVLAADIPFHHRFIYDMDMSSCIKVTGDSIDKNYATDVIIKMTGFENIDSFDPGLKILSFDIENSVEHGFIYTICSVIGEDGKIRECDAILGPEKKIIEDFSKLIEEEDPDVITGYNIDNYDIRKILERAEINKMKDALPWGRDHGQPRIVSERFWRVKGRMITDAWWAAKKELRPKQETLNAVSKQVLGETKLDVDPKHMDEEWAKDQAKVIKYCFKDSELALKILLHVGTLRKGMDLATVAKLPLEDVLTAGSSQLADSLLIRAADRNKIGVPLMGRRNADSDQIEGGYVHTMTPGLYHWVCVEDFKSMYPSLIIAKNICFTTLSPEGEILSPSGARFLAPAKRVGILPGILSALMNQRDSIKKRMKSTSDPYEHQYLDGLQAAVKVLMNTFYGVFASSFYRFTDKNIGAAITAFARDNVKSIIKEVESEGVSVIYSDTDSVFMQSPYKNLEGSVKFGNEMSQRFSRDGGTLEFEKLVEPLFTHGKKKRYVGKIVWPTTEDELLVRGYEIRRSDSFDLQSNLLMEVFKEILDEDDEGAVALVKKTVQDVLAGKVEPSELVISRTCKGLNDAYENPERMANVQAAKKLMKLGYNFIPGMKVSWIVTDAKKTPQEVEPYVSGVEFTAKPDYEYYAERLAQMASRVTEVFGWTEKDLLLGSQQKTLFDSFGPSSDNRSKTDVKKEPPTAPKKPQQRKNANLDDFS
ncbi:MAG: DNA polymerase II [Candidatus Methanogranum gryphiswaldense]|nr:MAG: DNA polymerase II [Candidatus Methanogranum sp. U3.2.1]